MSLSGAQGALQSAILAAINSDRSNSSQAATDLAQAIYTFVTAATVTVPGAGLVAPSGGGPVTGNSTTGTLS